MRKLATLAIASLCLGYTASAFAQSEAAPQTGLPPGAAFMAPNAAPPRASGRIGTATTGGAAPMAAPMSAEPAPMPVHRVYHRHHHVVHHYHHHVVHHTPVAAPAPAANQ